MNMHLVSSHTPQKVRTQPEQPQLFAPTQLRSAPALHRLADGQRVIRGAVAAAPREVSTPLQKEIVTVNRALAAAQARLDAATQDLSEAKSAGENGRPDAALAQTQKDFATEQVARLTMMRDDLTILAKNGASSDPNLARSTDSTEVREVRAEYNLLKGENQRLEAFYHKLGHSIGTALLPPGVNQKPDSDRVRLVWEANAEVARRNVGAVRGLRDDLPAEPKDPVVIASAKLAEAVMSYQNRIESEALILVDKARELNNDHPVDSADKKEQLQFRRQYTDALAKYDKTFRRSRSGAPSADRLDSDNRALALALALHAKRELPAAKRSINAAFRAIADPRRELPSQALKAVDTLNSMRTAVATIGKLIEGGVGPNAVAINRAVNRYNALRHQLPPELAG